MSRPPEHFVYAFAEFTVDSAKRLVAGADGVPVVLSAKPFDALVYLLEHAGRVVSRAELAQALWPQTVVEDNNLSQTILALRRALHDDAEQAQYVITVPRRGYQFIAPVERRAAAASAPAPPPASAPALHRRAARRPAIGFLVAGVALGVLATWFYWADGAPTGSERAPPDARAVLPRSVAVLPFKNLSPRSEDAFFAAGIHEEVLSQLARIHGVNVIGATSVARYAEENASIPAIATELNVGAVVEGSVRFAAERVRVSVRLLDASTGTEAWNETYDTPLDDVFAVQNDIAEKIAAALEPALAGAQRVQAQATESAEAYAAYLQAVSLYRLNGGIGVGITPPVRAAIVAYLDEALTHDPQFAAALAWRANVNVDSLLFDPWPDAERDALVAALVKTIETDAAAALAADPTLGIAHAALARLYMCRWQLDEARAAIDRALELNPSDSVAFHYGAMIDFIRNDLEAAVRSARRALELDPKNPAPHAPLSMALRALGDLDRATATYREMIDVAPTAAIGYVGLARTLTARDEDEEVLRALALAEQFMGDLRSFRLDAALSYAHVGRLDAAARLVEEFKERSAGYRIDPALAAMAALAVGDYEEARAALRIAVAVRSTGLDPLPLEQIRRNTWSDPVLDQPEWQQVRASLAWR